MDEFRADAAVRICADPLAGQIDFEGEARFAVVAADPAGDAWTQVIEPREVAAGSGRHQMRELREGDGQTSHVLQDAGRVLSGS